MPAPTWIFDPEIYLDVEPTVEVFPLLVSDDSEEFSMEMDMSVVIGGQAPYYTGSYEVNPSFSEQTLETRNKILEEDVTVHAIEVSRTSNPAGGTTVYIGGEINHG